MKKVVVLITTILFVGFIACDSNDDKNNAPNNSGLGEINFTVTGEVEGDFSGMADFHHFEMMNSETWEISGNNYDPQTFSLQFMSGVVGDVAERPLPGIYTIGNTVKSDYKSIFTHIPNGSFSNSTEYSSIYGENSNSGTLTITTSNEETVNGSFEFTAYRVDNNLNIVGTIEATGEFTANKRIN